MQPFRWQPKGNVVRLRLADCTHLASGLQAAIPPLAVTVSEIALMVALDEGNTTLRQLVSGQAC